MFTKEQVHAAWFSNHCEKNDLDEMAVRGREILAYAMLVASAHYPAGAELDLHRYQLGQVDSPVVEMDAGYIGGSEQHQLVALRVLRTNAQLAAPIYRSISGADNKAEHEATVAEILTWLDNGEPVQNQTVQQLTMEYLDYLADAEEAE